MGPQLDSCGRYSGGDICRKVDTLQWGRNLTVAEGVVGGGVFRKKPKLQWGRNLTVAEGGRLLP